MRAPAGASKGKAKVIVSFPDWKEGKVIQATFAITILEDDPAKAK